jgi:hypothetical protein
MPERKFAEAPTITIGSRAEFDEVVAHIAHLEAQDRDAVSELQLAALLEAAEAYIRRHNPRSEQPELDRWRERHEGREG